MSYTLKVEAASKEIITYLTEDGRSPFDEWVASLRDNKTVSKISTRLYRAALGNLGDMKPVGEGVSEMRLQFGPGYRIYFGQQGDRVVVLLCGGDKGTQAKDIKRAQEFWADFKRREQNV
jgi:putative addiction module killer protein